MALPLPPINPNNPIPNNPFYYPETNYIRGEYGPFIVGSGLSIDSATGVISATGGGGGGGVTQVNTGTGLTGGPITSTGTLSLAASGVTAGSYSTANITVDSTGRVTSASSGPAAVTSVTGTSPINVVGFGAPVISINNASTTGAGAVQLYDGTNSTSTALALTAAQGKSLQDQINALTSAGGLTLAGTFDATTGLMATVTSAGTGAGFGAGAPLPSPTPANLDYFVIATVPGTYDPPGPSGPFTITVGDWLLSDGTQWSLLDVGASPAYASTAVAGIVCLSTNALAQAGTDTITALTPAAARSAYVPLACYPTKGALVAGTSVASAPSALPVGTDGYILTADAACTVGFAWKAAPGGVAAIPCACVTSKGALISGTGPSTPVALTVGTNGQILAANSACTTGLQWQTGAVGPWINAGTIQSVGLSATTTAPTLGTSSRNNVSYRQVGPKEWEVVYVFASSSGYNPGSGDWLFRLPGGLQFDTTLAWQPIFQQNVLGGSHAGRAFILPGPSVSQVAFTGGSNGSQFGSGAAVWNTTRWRFLTTSVGDGSFRAISSGYWGNSAELTFLIRFQFTSV